MCYFTWKQELVSNILWVIIDPDPKSIQQINFTGNLSRAEVETIFFIIDETVLGFSKGTVQVL